MSATTSPKDAVLCILLMLFVSLALVVVVESGIGVNWGTVSLHKLSPTTVVNLLKDNKIGKVKLFDADPDSMRALMGSGIEVMVGIPNEMLPLLSSSTAAADSWLSQNVSRYMGKGGVNIKYVFSLFFRVSLIISLALLSSVVFFVLLMPVAH